MATAAARPRKRDLARDWRDALRASVRRFAMRSWGAILVGLSLALARARGSHSTTDPYFSTAPARPPTNRSGS